MYRNNGIIEININEGNYNINTKIIEEMKQKKIKKILKKSFLNIQI